MPNDEPLVIAINQDEHDRAVRCLVTEHPHDNRPFFSVGPALQGVDCIVNTAEVARIDMAAVMAGLPVQVKPWRDLGVDERAEADDSETVVLRFWLKAEAAPQVWQGVDYGDWMVIEDALQEATESQRPRFISFTDGDEEIVILATAEVRAVEMFDSYLLSDEEMERAMKNANQAGMAADFSSSEATLAKQL
jgi:hypothetical protein